MFLTHYSAIVQGTHLMYSSPYQSKITQVEQMISICRGAREGIKVCGGASHRSLATLAGCPHSGTSLEKSLQEDPPRLGA